MPTADYPPKDPNDILDYVVDWTSWLPEGDTISTSTFELEPGAEIVLGSGIQAPSHTANTTTMWLTGGVEGKMYAITNRIVTAQGRQKDRTVRVLVKST